MKMRKIFLFSLFFVVLLLACTDYESFMSYNYTYTVSGSVKTTDNTGYEGAILTLGGNTSKSAKTDSSGAYAFEDAAIGKHSITLTVPANYAADTTIKNIVVSASNNTGNDFIIAKYCTISGTVSTSTGTKYSGATINLSGFTTASTTTNSEGFYSFSVPPNKTYKVSLVVPTNYIAETTEKSISLAYTDSTGNNFTITRTYSISGTVSGYIGTATIEILDYASNKVNSKTTSGNGGTYTFAGLLKDSTYTVKLTIPTNCIADDTTETYKISDNVTKNFTLSPIYSISGTINLATNNNGTSAFTGGSVSVSLSGATNKTINTSDGLYSFNGLTTGSYTVTITNPTGYYTKDTVITINPLNADKPNQNFTIKKLYSISGKVSGYNSANLTLSGDSSATTTTSTDGSYSFTGLVNGNYKVTLTIPTNYIADDTIKDITISDANVVDSNFVLTPTYSISGTVNLATASTTSAYTNSAVTVTLSNGKTTTTNTSDGSYSFSGLLAGSYTVTLTTPTGYYCATTTISVNNLNADKPNQDFTIEKTYKISGKVTGYTQATVVLGGKSTSSVKTSTTDSTYSFTGLTSGSYTVTLTIPDATYFADDTTEAITITNGDITKNFALTKTYTISGTINLATNNNGTSAFTGGSVSVSLSGATNKTINTSDGLYSFNGLTTGSYTVTITNPTGYYAKDTVITINPLNADKPNQNFTIKKLYSISGKVSGYNSANLTLSGDSSATTTTSTDGSYSFANLVNGNYKVTLTIPTGYIADDTIKDITISDANVVDSNFVLTPTYSISGTVNLATASTTSAYTNSAVTVTLSNGKTTTTNTSNGSYSFSGLLAGSYTVTLTTPTGYYCATTTISVNNLNADKPNQDFTIEKTYKISGKVTGYTQATVVLGGKSTSSVQTSATDSTYSFTGLASGSYTVTLTIPDATYFADDTTEAITITNGDITKNFALTKTYTISGTVKLGGSNFTETANVTISGGSLTASKTIPTTNGSYSLSGLVAGSYTVTLTTPTGYYCATTTISVNNLNADKPNQDFTIEKTYKISGKVTGYTQATVVLGGKSTSSVQTSATDSTYSFTGLTSGSYTVTLTIPDATYFADDTTEAITITNSDITKNFALTKTYTISGTVKLGGSNFTGSADVTISGGSLTASKTIPTINGSYSLSGLVAGSYTVTLTTPTGYYCAATTISVNNLTADKPNQDFTIEKTYKISGKVSGYTSANLTLSGDSSATTTTSTDGSYSFTGLVNGNYKVTLTIPTNYIADDTIKDITISDANVVDSNFVLTQIYSISGTINLATNNNGTSAFTGGSVSVSLSGATNKTITTNNGSYSFDNLLAGSYTVTITNPTGYYTKDTVITINPLNADKPNQNFTIKKLYSISGKVSGYNSANLTLSGGSSATTTTSTDGSYSFTGLVNGNYKVTLTIPTGYIAYDTIKDITISDANVVDSNFVLTLVYSVSGTVSTSTGGTYKGATITLSGSSIASTSTATGTGGTYAFNKLFPGTYTVTLSVPSGYTATTTSLNFTISSDSVTGQNFTITTTVPPISPSDLKTLIANGSDVTNVNTSNIIDMSSLFQGNTTFNQDISNWDVSKVTNMLNMFSGATKFNQNIGNWNVSSVTNMSYMFRGATSFNQDLNNWTTTNVTNMSNMFFEATKFNQNIGNWNVSSVTDMSSMFRDAKSFNQDLNNWTTTNVTNMSNMFYGDTTFNGNISNWNVSKVTDMSNMFRDATSFNQDLNNWTTTNVTNMSQMFNKATNFNGNISSWDVGKVTDMNYMFLYATSFNQNLSSWITTNVIDMRGMFFNATSFNQNLSSWTFNPSVNHTYFDTGASAWNSGYKPTFP